MKSTVISTSVALRFQHSTENRGGKVVNVLREAHGLDRVYASWRKIGESTFKLTIFSPGVPPLTTTLSGVSEKGVMRRARKFVRNLKAPVSLRESYLRLSFGPPKKLGSSPATQFTRAVELAQEMESGQMQIDRVLELTSVTG